MIYLLWFARTHFLTVAILAMFSAVQTLSSAAWGQANTLSKNVVASNLVRPEYYVGMDYFADAQTVNASSAFGLAIGQSRSMGELRGIDHIPPIVMQGECYLAQCNIGAAMEKFDDAIQLSFAARRWVSLIKNPAGAFRADPRLRDITWVANKRGTQMGQFPESWQIGIATPDVLVELSEAIPPGKAAALDALEILRCQAIAFRRRQQLLGELTRFMPITAPVIESYRASNGMSEPIACAINICRALAEWSNGEKIQSMRTIKQNLSLSNGLDHPLTAIGLLALSDAAIEMNELQEAEDRASEAALASARAGQMDHLAEAIEYLSKTAVANSHESSAAKTIQLILAWAGNRSRLVVAKGQSELVRLASATGDADSFRKHANLATTMLAPKQVALPRAEAVVSYAKARMEYLEGRKDEGDAMLRECVGQLATPDGGIGTPSLFQFDMAIKLLFEMKNDAAANALTESIRGPSIGVRRTHSLEQIPLLLANKTAAAELVIEHRLATHADAELVRMLDESMARHYRKRDETLSRAFDIQMAMMSDLQHLNPSQAQTAQFIRSQLPSMAQNAARFNEQMKLVRATPKWDARKWGEEDNKRWEGISRQADTFENLCLANSISHVHVPELFPPVHSDEILKANLQTTDIVLYFVDVGSRIKAYLYADNKWSSWTIAQPDALVRNIQEWSNDLQTLRTRDVSASEVSKFWQNGKRLEIRNQLIPKEKWNMLRSSRRWIVIPTASLWALPFEVLPLSDQPSSLPSIAEHRIVYSPILGLVPHLVRGKSVGGKHVVDIHSGDFFSRNAIRAKEIREDLATSGKHVILELGIKGNVFPASRYIKSVADQVYSYTPMSGSAIAPIPTDRQSVVSDIHQWRRLPWGAPETIVIPGSQLVTSMTQKNGNDWIWNLLPSLGQGTRHMLIARWSVGGESASILMKSFLDNRQEMTASEAWQRSVVSSWEERIDARNEPLFRENASPVSLESPLSGFHPLLWTGYFNLGDSQ